MARIVFAWELGAGYGHAHRMAAVARLLAARGHAVAVVTQAVPLVTAAFAGIPCFIAAMPPILAPAPPDDYADSYAEVLLRCGFADPALLAARLNAWMTLFDRHAPDLLVADFAPTAMLAARLAGIPVAIVENGYTLPPATDPLPSTKAWADIAPDRLRALDGQALAAINAGLAMHGGRALARLADLFDVAAPFLCSFPELDHYPDRGAATYVGPIYADGQGAAPTWPDLPGPRVFAYLDAGHPAFGATVAALRCKGWPSLMHVRGGQASQDSGSVRLSAAVVQLGQALAQCDLVVCQGLATVSAALLAGRPVVQLPSHLEQAMILHRVVRQGLGVGVMGQADQAGVTAALDLVRDDPSYRRRATSFSQRYHGFTSALAAEAVAVRCAAVIAGRMPPQQRRLSPFH